MATVYLAQDLRHDRPVALKVLHPELAASLGPERFQREIRMAARLQHPHILSVHDSGEVPATPTPPVLWFAMPFVEGESLRDRLTRERQLPMDDAVRIAREAADALEYAHRHGVIHRDIKPENILLADGHALVADFGIARGRSAGDGDGRARLTETGTTLGTPAYMSPEQAAGERRTRCPERHVLARPACCTRCSRASRRSPAPTAQAMIARRFTETPRPLRWCGETVPEGVERAVARALAKSPADRFASAAEFGAGAGAGRRRRGRATPPRPPRRRPPRSTAVRRRSARRRRRSPSSPALGLGFLLGLGVLFGWLRSHAGESRRRRAPSGWRCCRSRTWATPRTSTSPTA